jgi:hypothetical protein
MIPDNKLFSEIKNMEPIATTTIIGVALTIFVPMLMRLPSERKRYQRMDDQKLIDTRVFARMMRGVMIAIILLGPIPFAFLIGVMKNPSLTTLLLCTMIGATLCGVMGFWMFFEMVRLATTELETRKFQEEKKHGTNQVTLRDDPHR